MSYCKEEGKDRIIFVAKEDHDVKNPLEVDDYEDEQEGLINDDGSINWDCQCLGGMASGPCGVEFRSSFTCFHYSTEDPKGSDCLDQFRTLHECMGKYPEYYTRTGSIRTSDDEGGDEEEGEDVGGGDAGGGGEDQAGGNQQSESNEDKKSL